MFDRQKAFQHILDFMKKNTTLKIEDSLFKKAIEEALKADMEYMIQQGLLKEIDGQLQATEKGFYDDDEAFEFIMNALKKQKQNISVKDLPAFVDEYMDAAESFLEEADLLGWDA